VRRSASSLSVQAIGHRAQAFGLLNRAQAFGLLTGVVVGGSTRLILPWDPSGHPVPMAW
jgi:hypothetical protein